MRIPLEYLMKNKPWDQMTTAELREATKDLNGTVLDKTRPLNAAERALWRKSRGHARRNGSSRQKSERINIRLENGLLKQADKIARKKGLDRSELIAQALATVIGRKAV
jgi:antitoxin component of RelBE/YafQ-DinJ toxin-antitoxin module